jgi:hypothetical protein
MSKTKIKLAVFGPKPCFLSGHDLEDKRKLVRDHLLRKIQNLQANNFTIQGVGGIDLGVEQDFLEICRELKIPYVCYVSSILDEKRWAKLPKAYEKIKELVEGAIRTIVLSNKKYSPKKNMEKVTKIIEEADMIFVFKNRFDVKSKSIVNICEENKKTYVIINV